MRSSTMRAFGGVGKMAVLAGVLLFVSMLSSCEGGIQAKPSRPGQYASVQDMAKWEQHAVKDIVHSVFPDGDDGDNGDFDGDHDGDHDDHDDGDYDGDDDDHHHDHHDHHAYHDGDDDYYDDGDGDSDAYGNDGEAASQLAEDVAEQGQLWNELTKMEKDADAMVAHASDQGGSSFQHAENSLFEGALNALHTVDTIDSSVKEAPAAAGGGDGKKWHKKNNRVRGMPAVKRPGGVSEWATFALIVGLVCMGLAMGGLYVFQRQGYHKVKKDDFIDDQKVDEAHPL